jgi:hypothetical protein
MDTTKSLKCRIGRHHWDFTTQDRMVVRTCTECGLLRRREPASSDRWGGYGGHEGTWGLWGINGGFGGSDGGGFGGDGGGGGGGGGCDGGGGC